MKVKELIEKLQEFDGDEDVYIHDNEDGLPLVLIDGGTPLATFLTDLRETNDNEVFLY